MQLSEHVELTPAWREITARLQRIVGETTYELWLAPIEPRSWDGSVLVLDAPATTRAWVAKRYARALERSVRAVMGTGAGVAFADAGAPRGRIDGAAAAPEVPASDPHQPLRQRYTFDQFIIGDGNRLAHAAALAVAELPGDTYNPLFLHAPPGLGKTHLLHAIGNYLRGSGDAAVVRYTTVESFTNHFISSLGARTVERFKRMYRDVDVLLIDDVQFLASKARTEEEFFHTFNALVETGRQLVLTCDRLPRQLVGVEERLRERFESGLVASIDPPDLAVRVAILRKRVALDEIALADAEVLELIARRITDNVRALEGALIRIVAHHSLTGRPIDAALTAQVLDEIHPLPAATPVAVTVGQIQQAVAEQFDLTVDELLSSSRAERVSWPRQLAILLARDLTGASLPELGRVFGGRNHATILHSCRRVAERVIHSPEDAHSLDGLRRRLAAEGADLPS